MAALAAAQYAVTCLITDWRPDGALTKIYQDLSLITYKLYTTPLLKNDKKNSLRRKEQT